MCVGGIANTARRFDFLARALMDRYHVVCLDWAGRGHSGWLAEMSDYTLDAHVEQLRCLLDHLGRDRVSIIGSSMGGSAALRLAYQQPWRVERIVLNDIGPYIPLERRSRRAAVVGRHYVFRRPADLFRRSGAAQKNDGPVDDVVLAHNSFHQTRWSKEEGGRIYRHDPRALLAYRHDARVSLNLWAEWDAATCPLLVLWGELSDALMDSTVQRMQAKPGVTVALVPDTGHTPTLSDPVQGQMIRGWLSGDPLIGGDFSFLRRPTPRRILFGADG
ncbi:MAG: alpha/beta hydrolase [Alphaproteobacteria bacterium]